MNLKFKALFGHCNPALPLKSSGNVVCNNANAVNWTDVCPHSENSETYLVGNPPYLGSSLQSAEQKADMTRILGHLQSYKKLDYIATWFYRATQYIVGNKAKSAFVTTNSICQGEQVSILWPHIFGQGIEIEFAHQSFKWSNNAKKTQVSLASSLACEIPALNPNISTQRTQSELQATSMHTSLTTKSVRLQSPLSHSKHFANELREQASRWWTFNLVPRSQSFSCGRVSSSRPLLSGTLAPMNSFTPQNVTACGFLTSRSPRLGR